MTMTTPISAMTERFVPVIRLMEYQNRLAWETTETMMRFAMMPWQGFTSKAGFGSICAPAGVQRKAVETVEETTAKVAETVEETVAEVTAATEDNAEKVAETAAEMTAETVEAAGDEAETAIAAVKPKGLDAPRGGTADDLKQLEGVGPKLEEAINAIGIFHLDQIAKWTEAEVAWIDENLAGVRGRASRNGWVAQARSLAG